MNITPAAPRQSLGVVRGGALYVGALVGPGLLLVPALAAEAAGPASILAWGALLVVSVPLAITFAALGVRHPVAGGVAAYVRAGFGDAAAAVTASWFVVAVIVGAPAVSLIGGYYVAELTHSGATVAAAAGVAMFVAVLAANACGLRISSTLQVALSLVLIVIVAIAIALALRSPNRESWTPFAPRGWAAVGTAASILVWLFVGWEAGAQLVGDFRRPTTDLPRAMAIAFGVITVLYIGLAAATINASATHASRVPLADLIGLGLGERGRDATALLAVALTVGTMNVYVAGAARLVRMLAAEGSLPAWLAEDATRTVARRPLALLGLPAIAILAALAAGLSDTSDVVRATSAMFVAVYVLAIASAVGVFAGAARVAAIGALVPMLVLAVFSAGFLLVPMTTAVLVLALRYAMLRRRRLATRA